jgi:CRP/FNR family transcriptional regulator, cyclic AMP receptor protein
MSASAHLAPLTEAGWLATANPSLRQAILDLGRLRTLDQGEQFQKIGDQKVGMWGVAEGQVGISTVYGPANLTQFIYQPGEWGGYAPLLGSPRLADVFARMPTLILFIPYAPLQGMLANNPVWWKDLARLALHDAHRFGAWGADLLQKSSRSRTAAILLNLSGCRFSGNASFPVLASHAEIGEMANLSRHPVEMILHEFEHLGWIACGYRRLDLLDATALRRMADAG